MSPLRDVSLPGRNETRLQNSAVIGLIALEGTLVSIQLNIEKPLSSHWHPTESSELLFK